MPEIHCWLTTLGGNLWAVFCPVTNGGEDALASEVGDDWNEGNGCYYCRPEKAAELARRLSVEVV